MFVERLKDALGAEYVVMGGRNFKNVKKLPSGARLGDNRNVFCRTRLPLEYKDQPSMGLILY